jgi:adenine-specific DNA-methyltransferase
MPQLQFKGKQFVQNYHFTVPYRVLKPVPSKSFPKGRASLDDNLIIHGDNLAALKALLPKYAGQIKCIYIDPPYNTGNEHWIYSDNVNSPMMKEWLGKEVGRDDLTRHDKWLCMMMPRLKLLRELLRDDGVIFVSIDDNEVHHLRMLMDEIFGEGNFIGTLIWQRAKGGGIAEDVVRGHEYILVYKKREEAKIFLMQRGDKALYHLEQYKKHPDNYIVRNGILYYINDDIVRKVFGKYEKGTERRCEYEDLLKYKDKKTKEEVDKKLSSGEYILKKNSKTGKHFICRLEKVLEMKQKMYTIISGFLSEVGKNDLESLGMKDFFDYPKPVGLIKLLIESCTNKDDIILDSFAGSGTTGQAVLSLNKEDGGNRKFILVQLPEEIKKDTPAYKYGFRDVVEITAERMRRVIKGVPTAKDENLKNGLGGSFTFVELGEAIDNDGILSGKRLPSFIDMARYVFYTATGKNINEKKIKESTGFIGETEEYEVYLLYKPDLEWLKTTALDLEKAKKIAGKKRSKKKLVFAPAKYLDEEALRELNIEFAQLPFGIYRR